MDVATIRGTLVDPVLHLKTVLFEECRDTLKVGLKAVAFADCQELRRPFLVCRVGVPESCDFLEVLREFTLDLYTTEGRFTFPLRAPGGR